MERAEKLNTHNGRITNFHKDIKNLFFLFIS
jgi:hypothetical protein